MLSLLSLSNSTGLMKKRKDELLFYVYKKKYDVQNIWAWGDSSSSGSRQKASMRHLFKKTIFSTSNSTVWSIFLLLLLFFTFLVMHKTSTIRIETFWPNSSRCCCEASSTDFFVFFVLILNTSCHSAVDIVSFVVPHRLPMLVEKN